MAVFKAALFKKDNTYCNRISRKLSLPVEISACSCRSVRVCLCAGGESVWSESAQHIARSNNLLTLSALCTLGAVSNTGTDRTLLACTWGGSTEI